MSKKTQDKVITEKELDEKLDVLTGLLMDDLIFPLKKKVKDLEFRIKWLARIKND